MDWRAARVDLSPHRRVLRLLIRERAPGKSLKGAGAVDRSRYRSHVRRLLPLLAVPAFYFGLSGFFGRTAFGISSRSTGGSPPSNFGGPPLKTGGNFPTGILTVA